MQALRISCWSLAILLLGLGAAPLEGAPEEEPQDRPPEGTIVIREMLAIGRISKGGRVAVFQDPIEAQRVAGSWTTPEEGDTLGLPGAKAKAWTRIEADETGWFEDRLLRGGYAVATVTVPERRVMILNARGHRHVYVNGVPRGGDVYDHDLMRVAVELQKGTNELLFKGGRGRMRVALETPRAPLFIASRDVTQGHAVQVPDAGGVHSVGPTGITVINATTSWSRPLRLGSENGLPNARVFSLPPLGSQKVPAATAASFPAPPFGLMELERRKTRHGITCTLIDAESKSAIDSIDLRFEYRRADEDHLRSFVSDIDGSVQVFGVSPASAKDAKGLVLSCHGAGVKPMNQVRAYAPKDWCTVVAPTNRRQFGFDWEDWGRLDFLEVKREAERLFQPDPRLIHLTGHSMGGHGTWILGAQFPDRFGAIAPSAGWRDFWSYGGGAEWNDATPVQKMLERASNVSRTLLLEQNYVHSGIYVLHGDADTNVPVTQARFMRKRLAGFHTNFAYYEQPGAGHWWGNRCVDWKPLFQFLENNPIPTARSQEHVRFSTVNPAVSDRCYWVRVVSQLRSLLPSHVDAKWNLEKRELALKTSNVARLELDLRPFTKEETVGRGNNKRTQVPLEPGKPISLRVGERVLSRAWPPGGVLRLLADAKEGWVATDPAPAAQKNPHRAGPFKEAFRRRFLMVVGTQGTDEENAWALAKARYDADTWQYRGNGRAEIVRDRKFDPKATAGRNVILYGHRQMNAAWPHVLEPNEIDVGRGRARVGTRSLEGHDLGALFVYPRKDDEHALVGVIAGTGLPGMRALDQMPIFLSGAGFPDWLIVGGEMPLEGTAGIRGAGFFDLFWRVGPDSAWSD